jgi:vWA-MoxR associated protein C-terminal domain/vWA-MoxR associated protein middle region (VMAP-M) 1/Effector-associated domain 9
MQFEKYKSRLEGLKADCEAGCDQLNYTDDQVKRRRLEREQTARFKEMEQVAKECDQCEEELKELAAKTDARLPENLGALVINHQLLIDILTPHLAVIKTQIETAYQVASPIDWLRDMPKTLKGILIDLEDMPLDGQGYAAIAKFVAGLVVDAEIPETLRQSLQEWAEQHAQDFAAVLADVKQSFVGRSSPNIDRLNHSHLMVVVVRSGTAAKQMGDRYFVRAWFILDGDTYQPKKAAGFEVLTIPGTLEDAEKAFTWIEVEGLLKAFLAESGEKCLAQGQLLENLTIELFLPPALLNHRVDRWVMDGDDEYSMSEPIGFQHRIVLRSSERLRKKYLKSHLAGLWRDKWKRVRQMIEARSDQAVVSNGFVAGDGVVAKKLLHQLSQPQMIGLKLAQEPLCIGRESTFAALHSSATPIAIWLREPLTTVDCPRAVDALLGGCIHEIPERVKQHRQAAFAEDRDCHIGHHLCLLWEDFDRLPPDLDYWMAEL